MVRRYRGRPRISNRDKYSVEHTVCVTPSSNDWTNVAATETTQASDQFHYTVVPPTTTEGMRKVKHITLSFSANGEAGPPLLYALVFVPQGYIPNYIHYPLLGDPGSLYEPNQFVMSCGVLDFSGGPLRIRCPLSRNLNSGDSIHLVLADPDQGTSVSYTINATYAITLQ
uniref:Capsid protein n=1 Tax=unidentified TaxID=32644 RepID=A0A6G9W1N0_9ZZZZ|nr:hypothetical protein [unidentified]